MTRTNNDYGYDRREDVDIQLKRKKSSSLVLCFQLQAKLQNAKSDP